MSSTFSKAVELASKLPERDQEALGALLLHEMQSEVRWASLFKDSQDELSMLADEALADRGRSVSLRRGTAQGWDRPEATPPGFRVRDAGFEPSQG